MTTKEKVNEAFRILRTRGYFAKQKFWCCQNCAWNAMSDDEAKMAVFYHEQDNDAWEGKELKKDLHLAWSGNGEEILRILKVVGLEVEWDGSPDKRIKILATL